MSGQHLITDEEFAILSAKRRQAITMGRLERKVDELTKRVDAFNPNGTYADLKKLADHAAPLLELARVAPLLVEAVQRDADREAALRYIRRLLNPLKPVGAVFWLAISGLVTAIAWNIVSTGHPFN
jgi:hypothetical protein